MPRDATATRARLLREAERAFATRGVFQATLREITEGAGQRNSSALTYHFGSREGVLWAILERHNEPMDLGRASLVVEPLEDMPTRDLAASLLIPYADALETTEGRDYVRIVAQLTDLFPIWRVGPLSPPYLRRILGVLEARAGGETPAVRRERVMNGVMLLTSSIAERAKTIEGGGRHQLDRVTFLANLADVFVACIETPGGPPLTSPLGRALGAAHRGTHRRQAPWATIVRPEQPSSRPR